jgi:holo-[acyl-carrier protein] synthase
MARDPARVLSAIGVGVDLVEVSRVAAIIADKGARVFERLLTRDERAYCESRPDPATHVAVRLAAKEAVYKALQGTAVARGIGWREIEITRAPDGRPDVRLMGTAAERARELGVGRVLLSLSHTHLAAVAVVVLERV